MSFTLQPMNPEAYRRDTRRIAFIVIAIFVLLAMLLSTLAVQLFGEPGGDNFRFNLGGVLLGLLLTIALVRFKLWSLPWMAPAVYGWRLKRSLMSITNVMHHVTAGVAAEHPAALKLLRFYHLGVTQMHQLDGNSSALSQMVREIDQHKARLEALGLPTEFDTLEPEWLVQVRQIPV